MNPTAMERLRVDTVSVAGSMPARNRADYLIDRVRGALLSNTCPDWDWCHSQLASALELAPDLVQAYHVLVAVVDRLGSATSPDERHRTMLTMWRRYGQNDLSARQFIDQYVTTHDPYATNEIPHAVTRDGALLVQFSRNLAYLDLLEVNSRETIFLGRVQQPQLVCCPRDFEAIPPNKRTVLEDLLKRGKHQRVVRHWETTVAVRPSRVFGPAIDTVYFNMVLRTVLNQVAARAGWRHLVEVGSGSGFLLCSAIQALPALTRVTAIDIQRAARSATLNNLQLMSRSARTLPDVAFILGHDGLAQLPDGSVDVLQCNPPYIPSHLEGRPLDNAYEGTELLRDILLGEGPRVLSRQGVGFLLYSSLCEEAVAYYRSRSPMVCEPIGEPRWVPLDLREISSDPRWIDHLQAHHQLHETMDDARYTYWHRLSMLAVFHPNNPLRGAHGHIFSD